MANKDHSLDSKIIEASLREFKDKGFDKASLRKIAADAGVTVGAIYTRYRTKDILFSSLVEPLIEKIGLTFSEIKQVYFDKENFNFKDNMQKESEAILHILFDDYERAFLLLCRSRGSSLENFFDLIINKKIESTLEFFKTARIESIKPNVVKMLVGAQFHMYYEIMSEGYDLDTAKEMMNAAIIYHTGGWLSLLQGE